MGDNEDNIKITLHACGGVIIDVGNHRHLGSASVDTPSSPASPAAWDVYAVAVQDGASDTVVHAAGRSAFGTTWYNTNIRDVTGADASLRVLAERWRRL